MTKGKERGLIGAKLALKRWRDQQREDQVLP